MRLKRASCLILAVLIPLSGCVLPARLTQEPPPLSTRHAQILQTLTPDVIATPEHTSNTETPEPLPVTTITESLAGSNVYLHPGLPESIVQTISKKDYQVLTEPIDGSGSLQLAPMNAMDDEETLTIWTYALVAPFFTLTDGISSDTLRSLWQGHPSTGTPFTQIIVTQATRSAMIELFGAPDPEAVITVSEEALTTKSLTNETILGIVPFENLIPQFKVLKVDGSSPLNKSFNPVNYPLSVNIWIEGTWSGEPPSLPQENFNPNKRTMLLMTGVTALTRATAYQMATRGETFPGKDIRNWLLDADITHISHEVPFAENCPNPNPVQADLIFCAAPERIALLEDIDADVIELTGNHLLDYGEAAARLTIEMYRDRNWSIYAGGLNLSEAQTPARITHNGNKLAFIGCNLPGPPNVWASPSSLGAAPCSDAQWLEEAIQQSAAEGYLPIVTFQYNEDYSAIPSPQMESDFLRMAEAGAVVVNGSQAHTPKIMVFHQNSFLHYGLGNLFFDQMEVYYQNTLMQGTRDEFIDRLVFYDNRLVSIELLTAKLEDYARPRPMTEVEREAFLSRIFNQAAEYQKESVP